MATIKRFEDLDAWKVSRELCDKIGKIIDSEACKKNFRLIGQVEGSSGSIMEIILQKDLKGEAGQNLLCF
jgi:hypothetical protein